MSIKKTDVLGNMVYASVSMACANEIPGYNGTLFAISEETKERIEADLVAARAAVDELIEAAKRADKLIRLLTVRQVIEAGDEYIEAAGLNPYCMNEGLAEGGDRVRLMCLEFALANVGGAS
jgi:hypothetical protein